MTEEEDSARGIRCALRVCRCYSDGCTSSSTLAKVSGASIEPGIVISAATRAPTRTGLCDSHSWTSTTFSAFQFTAEKVLILNFLSVSRRAISRFAFNGRMKRLTHTCTYTYTRACTQIERDMYRISRGVTVKPSPSSRNVDKTALGLFMQPQSAANACN